MIQLCSAIFCYLANVIGSIIMYNSCGIHDQCAEHDLDFFCILTVYFDINGTCVAY